MQSPNFMLAKQLKMCWWIALLSPGELGEKDSKWMKHKNETCPDIIKLKHVRNGENVIVCKNRNKVPCVVRQVTQSANCAPARRLKMCWLMNLGCFQWWTRNEPLRSAERLICYPSLQWICVLRQVMHWTNCAPARWLKLWNNMEWNRKLIEVGGLF